MMKQRHSNKSSAAFTTALIAGLAWGEFFSLLDNLPYFLDSKLPESLYSSLRGAVYISIFYCLFFSALLGVIGLLAWGILRIARQSISRIGLFGTYIGLAMAITVAALGLSRRSWEAAGTLMGALPGEVIVGLLGPLLGAIVGGSLYLLLRRWQKAGRTRLLCWSLLRNAVLALFASGLLVLLPMGTYRAYLQSRPLAADELSGEVATPEHPNIIFITIDSLRADYLSSYGHDPRISPNINALAQRGIRFEQVIAQSSWTLPSTASFCTSLYPTELQIECPWGSPACASQVDEYRTTLAELMKQAGYRTEAYLSNPWTSEYNGFLQGVDHAIYPRLIPFDLGFLFRRPIVQLLSGYTYDFKIAFGRGYNLFVDPSFPPVDGGELVNHHARPFLRRHQGERFFLWLFYMDVHAPYNPPRPYRQLPEELNRERELYLRSLDYETLVRDGPDLLTPEDLPALVSLYKGTIVYTDQLVGEILNEVDALGLTDRTLILLHADHGEEFLEHGGYSHGGSLYQETIGVPLIVAGPVVSRPGRVVEVPVALLDLLPTLADVARVRIPPEAHGRSLLPVLQGGNPEPRTIYSEGLHQPPFDAAAVLEQGQKAIHTIPLQRVELYDLNGDPDEREDLSQTDSAQAERLLALLAAWQQRAQEAAKELPRAAPAMSIDDDAVRELLDQAGY